MELTKQEKVLFDRLVAEGENGSKLCQSAHQLVSSLKNHNQKLLDTINGMTKIIETDNLKNRVLSCFCRHGVLMTEVCYECNSSGRTYNRTSYLKSKDEA